MSYSSLSSLCNNATSNLVRRSRLSSRQHHGHSPLASHNNNNINPLTRTSKFYTHPVTQTGTVRSLSSLVMCGNTVHFNPLLLSGTQDDSTSTTTRGWEVLLSVGAAVAASAALVTAFPSSSKGGGGGSSGGGGGGGSGGPPQVHHSLMYGGAPLQEDVLHEPVQQPQEKKPALTSTDQRKVYEISARAIKGGRNTMEDEYFVADGGRFAAVFDGHGGGGVSSFLKHHLYGRLTESLDQLHTVETQQHDEPYDDQQATPLRRHPSLSCQVAALRSAFTETEDDVLSDDSLQYQGSTAVAVVLHDDGGGSNGEQGHRNRTVLSANVGDSRAILSRHGHAVELTRDHKPNEEREKARILSMGETIQWDRFAKVHRVRNLSLSRAIGDRYAKPFVSAEVEIMRFPVNEHGDEFILLASDGLWDVMTSQDVVSYVHHQMANEMGRNHHMDKEEKQRYKRVLRRNMSKFVAREALKRGSGDNVCVVMVWLDDAPNPAS